MHELSDVLEKLTARLPELEWRLSETKPIALSMLPRGLFHSSFESTWLIHKQAMDEIRQDLARLQNAHEIAAHRFLAQRIHHKMNVLLYLCQSHRTATSTSAQAMGLAMDKLMTRQQWIKTLEQDIERLTQQQKALQDRLITHESASEIAKSIQVELSQITQKLTEAQRALASA